MALANLPSSIPYVMAKYILKIMMENFLLPWISLPEALVSMIADSSLFLLTSIDLSEPDGTTITLSVVDTPGFGNSIDNSKWYEILVRAKLDLTV